MGAPKGPRGPRLKIHYTASAAVIGGVRYPVAELPENVKAGLIVRGLAAVLTEPKKDIAAVWEAIKESLVPLVEADPDALWREAAAIVLAESMTRNQPGKTKRNSPDYPANLAAQRVLTAAYTEAQLAIAKCVPAIIAEHLVLSGNAASLDDLAPALAGSETAAEAP